MEGREGRREGRKGRREEEREGRKGRRVYLAPSSMYSPPPAVAC